MDIWFGNKLGLLFLQLTRWQIKWGYCSFIIEQLQLGKLHLYSLKSEGCEKHSLSYFAVLTVSPQSKHKEHPTSKLLHWVFTVEHIYLWIQKVFVCFVWSCVPLFPVGMYSLSNPIPEKERNSLSVWPHNNITLPPVFASSLSSSERMWDQKSSFQNGVTATLLWKQCWNTGKHTHKQTIVLVFCSYNSRPHQNQRIDSCTSKVTQKTNNK